MSTTICTNKRVPSLLQVSGNKIHAMSLWIQQVWLNEDSINIECEQLRDFIITLSGGAVWGSAGAGVELMIVVLAGFVGVELLVQELLTGDTDTNMQWETVYKDCNLNPNSTSSPIPRIHLLTSDQIVLFVLTVPAALWPAACCNDPSESASLSSALLLSCPPPLLFWTASAAGVPKLHSESFQRHVVSKDGKKTKF